MDLLPRPLEDTLHLCQTQMPRDQLHRREAEKQWYHSRELEAHSQQTDQGEASLGGR